MSINRKSVSEYCRFLGIGENCTVEELKSRYRYLINEKGFHPDKQYTAEDKSTIECIFKEIKEAYDFILNYMEKYRCVSINVWVNLKDILHDSQKIIKFVVKNPINGYDNQKMTMITIPAGIENNGIINLHYSEKGISIDLNISVIITDHPDFIREATQIENIKNKRVIEISTLQVLNEESIQISTLEGFVDIKLKQTAKPMSNIKLKGFGLPFKNNNQNRGDQIITLNFNPNEDLEDILKQLKLAITERNVEKIRILLNIAQIISERSDWMIKTSNLNNLNQIELQVKSISIGKTQVDVENPRHLHQSDLGICNLCHKIKVSFDLVICQNCRIYYCKDCITQCQKCNDYFCDKCKNYITKCKKCKQWVCFHCIAETCSDHNICTGCYCTKKDENLVEDDEIVEDDEVVEESEVIEDDDDKETY